MKKAFLILLVLVLAGTGCQSAGPEDTIRVLNYGEYMDPDLLGEFEQATGIRVIYEIYPTPEDMYTKVQAGGASYDLIITSDYMVERMISEERVRPLDFGNIPNHRFIARDFRGLPYDPEDRYSVPYFWGTLGILYNTRMVEGTPDSWDLLWDARYQGQIIMMDSQRDSLGAALRALGYSLNTTDPEELREARDLLLAQKPLVLAYVVDEVKDMMIGEEGAIALLWSGEAVAAMDENPDLAYYVPREGSNIWVDAMFVPADARNPAGAEAFIDFLCETENTLRNVDYVWYSTVHSEALTRVDAGLFENPGFHPPAEVQRDAEMFRYLGDAVDLYSRVWTEVLAH